MTVRRPTLIAAAAVALAALFGSATAAPAFAVPTQYVGSTSGWGTWPDTTLDAPITVGALYTSSFTFPDNGHEIEDFSYEDVPSGLAVTLDYVTSTVTIFGTPTGDDDGLTFAMSFEARASEDTWTITFDNIEVDPGLPASATSLFAPAVAQYTSIPLQATVSGAAPTGMVNFSLDAGAVGSATIGSGTASLNASLDSEYVGQTVDAVAAYAGDAGNAPSSSSPSSIYIYGSRVVSGIVSVSGTPIVGTTVTLLDGSTVVASSVTNSSGRYTITLPIVDSYALATATYLLHAERNGVDAYYRSGGPSAPTAGSATLTGPTQWRPGVDQNLSFVGVAPSWPATTVGDMQVGTAFSQAFAAEGDTTITYELRDDLLPAGVTFDAATGTLSGTPELEGPWSATIRATNPFGFADLEIDGYVDAAPALELVLQFAPGTRVGDAETDISASGLKVGSTYTLYMHSTPVLLYTGTVDASGAFLHTVSLPANTPVGAHELILSGIAPDGSVLTARAWFTLLADGTIGAVSYAGPLTFTLATAGVEAALPLGVSALLLAAGVYLVARRRRTA